MWATRQAVNNERTDLLIPSEANLFSEVTRPNLIKEAVARASNFLEPFTAPIKQSKDEQIRSYVHNKAPEYRPLLKHRTTALETIPPGLSEDKLDLELYKISLVYDTELREQSNNVIAKFESGELDLDRFDSEYDRFLEEWNEAGISKLARHIVHRRKTLDLLKATRRLNAKGQYELENAVHKIIFPLKKTSDDVPADKMNLWILDEKLAFHYYLASDIPFNQLKKDVVDSVSSDRADIVIFNQPAAFVNDSPPFASVVLIEFKRPARADYNDDENPISQVYSYVRTIKSGRAVDREGKPISVPNGTPFYAYVIADLTEKLRTQAENAQLTLSPDAMGYFGFNPQVGVYVEVISFDKLISDAEKRNAFLFHQLGMK